MKPSYKYFIEGIDDSIKFEEIFHMLQEHVANGSGDSFVAGCAVRS